VTAIDFAEEVSPTRSASMDSARSVTVGLAYEVCRDRGVITAIKKAAGESDDEDGDGGGGSLNSRNGSLSSSYLALGESTPTFLSEHPPLEKAFSSKTQMQLRVSRGKSYEGEHFSLSWKITLEVPLKPRSSASSEGGSTGFGTLLRKRDKAAAPAVATKKRILDGIMGHAEKGQLVAVMGSSGCGKTSFLDCISMRNQSFRGNIFV